MAIGDITKNVIYRVKSDTKDAAAGFGALDRAVEAVSLEMKHLGSETTETEGKLSRLVDGAKGKWKSFGDGLDSVGKAMTPLNQALELGGKAVKFLGDGLEAYSKTNAKAAAEVSKLTREFDGLKQSAMAAVGAITVGFAQSINPIEAATKAMRGFEGAVVDAFNAYQKGAASRGFEYLLGGGIIKDVRDSIIPSDPWAVRPSVDEMLARFKPPSRGGAAPKTDTAGAPIGWSTRAQANFTDAGDLNEWLGPEQSTTKNLGAGLADMFKQLGGTAGEMATGIRDVVQAATDFEAGPTFLEKLGLHDPSALELASTSLTQFTTSYQSAMQALGESSKSGKDVFATMLAEMVKSLGMQLAAFGAAELIKGAAMLATFNPKGFAHIGAAGLYSVGAVAAFAAAKAISPNVSAPASRAGGASAGTGSATTESGEGRWEQDYQTVHENGIVETGSSWQPGKPQVPGYGGTYGPYDPGGGSYPEPPSAPGGMLGEVINGVLGPAGSLLGSIFRYAPEQSLQQSSAAPMPVAIQGGTSTTSSSKTMVVIQGDPFSDDSPRQRRARIANAIELERMLRDD